MYLRKKDGSQLSPWSAKRRKGPKLKLCYGPFRPLRGLQGDTPISDPAYDIGLATWDLEDLEPGLREAIQRLGVSPVRLRNSVTRCDWSL
jgi:hypothetical protein